MRTGSRASSSDFSPTYGRVAYAAGLLALFATSAAPGALAAQTGAIFGRVVDDTDDAAVVNAHVRLREVGRTDLSHPDGSFHFTELGSRTYTVLAQRIGYAPAEARIELVVGDTVHLELRLAPSALELTGVVVTGTGRERRAGQTYQPTTVVGDSELRRRLEPSLAGTIAHVPGISQQYNGPAASQPVIRGMGGDRVLVLEDGQRTGDLATTGGDHAVSIDPMTAQRVEIVRGPAGLMYGSNALGGVINVVREEVPRTLPEATSGIASVQGESVNGGVAAGAGVLTAVGRVGLRAELSGRSAGDTSTPLGDLPSSDLRGFGGSLGASVITSWGYAGTAVRLNDLEYGVPGEFGGELIPGAHEDGVEIETRREAARIDAGHHLGYGPFSSFAFDANIVEYEHREIEGRVGERAIVGASFHNRSGGANLLARHEHAADPIFSEGAIGASVTARALTTGGGFTGSRDATERSVAAFVYEELVLEPFRIHLGGRYDWSRVTPTDLTPIRTGDRLIPVRERTFGSASASIATLIEPSPGVVAGASLARAFRTPSVEELFSDGPHLADYSYDIGNPELEPEIGIGGDVFVRISRPRLQAELSVFRNALRNYIYHAPTAEIDPRFGRFPLFVARGSDATFVGGEAGMQWEALRNIVVDGSISYVKATREEDGDPLPAIPPLNGMLELRYERRVFYLTAAWEAAAAQNRVPRAFPSPVDPDQLIRPEQPTAAYGLFNLGAGVRLLRGQRLHTLTLQIDNATDTVWRQHLSRIKEVAPQPGRNVQLLYRVQF
ncbi:MAG: TonB-dependent receptor [Gemmatimonadota bacterium]